jgi:hypothetical protein
MHFNSINTAILVGHFEFLVIYHLTILETIALNLLTPKSWVWHQDHPPKCNMYEYITLQKMNGGHFVKWPPFCSHKMLAMSSRSFINYRPHRSVSDILTNVVPPALVPSTFSGLCCRTTRVYPYMLPTPMNLQGKCQSNVSNGQFCCRETFFVVDGPGSSLLSWKASQKLNLIPVANNLTAQKPDINFERMSYGDRWYGNLQMWACEGHAWPISC